MRRPSRAGQVLDLVRGEGLLGKSRVLTGRGDGIEDHGDGLAGCAQEGERVGDRLQIEDGRPAGDQDQVGRPRRLQARRCLNGARYRGRASRLRSRALCGFREAGAGREQRARPAARPCGGRPSWPPMPGDRGRSRRCCVRTSAEATARCRARVVFPEPPFWLTMAMVFMRGLCTCASVNV